MSRVVGGMCMCAACIQPEDPEEPVSVLLPLPTPESNPDSRTSDGVVEWRPPHIDWNPWTSCSSYQAAGPYSTMEPEARADTISRDLCDELARRKAQDQDLLKVTDTN